MIKQPTSADATVYLISYVEDCAFRPDDADNSWTPPAGFFNFGGACYVQCVLKFSDGSVMTGPLCQDVLEMKYKVLVRKPDVVDKLSALGFTPATQKTPPE